jgi:hypothetical protein
MRGDDMAKASGAPDAPSGERQPTDERREKLQLGIDGVSCSFWTNGVRPEEPARPLGFQPDDFATAPGDEDYTPLRQLVLVTWADDAERRLLTSAQEVTEAEAAGDVSSEPPGLVVNIPLVTWPDGHR